MPKILSARTLIAAVLVPPLFAIACSGDGGGLVGFDTKETECTINPAELLDGGVGRDQIPALTDPIFVSPDHEDAAHLRPDDRVIGIVIGGRALAIPHNILWWHEIANLNLPEGKIAVTYCPLTGTAMAFDRSPIGGAELGVSGILFKNNLVMFNRGDDVTLFPQIMGLGVCGLRKQTLLPRLVIFEMAWDAWQARYPDTEVVSSVTGFSRNYQRFPYGNYESLDEPPFLPVKFSNARRPKERVMGIEGRNGGFLAVPFLELDELGALAVLNVEVDGEPFAVVWDRQARSAVTFSRVPRAAGGASAAPVTLRVEDGRIFDEETGSEWNLKGQAIAGESTGFALRGHARSMVAFWFAWASFNPDTEIWEG